MLNQETTPLEVLEEKLNDLMVPGFIVEMSPEEADMFGAFIEDALTDEDALEAKHG
ncbi:MAG: hypothetical protein LEGION0403_FIIPPAGN_02402 [Legionella sp.]|uniref:hypothetical protein n=1 Tax=Legionella sp. TaxID=459 RepID=UPI003D0F28DB